MMTNTEIFKALSAAGYKPADGEIGLDDDDGIYFAFSSSPGDQNKVQVIMKGPTLAAPRDHAKLLPGYHIDKVFALEPYPKLPAAYRQAVMATGFVSVILAPNITLTPETHQRPPHEAGEAS